MKRKRIGILGGGQLARMSAYQAYKLGFEIAILEKEHQSPAGQLTKFDYAGWMNNKKIIQKFIKDCDVITLENEFIDYRDLQYIEKSGKRVFPGSKTISLIQDKFIQKKTLQKNQIPVPNFVEVKDSSTYEMISEKLGKKFVLKSRKMGYDGYGNALVNNKKSYEEGIKKLSLRGIQILWLNNLLIFKKNLL